MTLSLISRIKLIFEILEKIRRVERDIAAVSKAHLLVRSKVVDAENKAKHSARNYIAQGKHNE